MRHVKLLVFVILITVLRVPYASGQVQGVTIDLPPGLEFLSEYLFDLGNDGIVNPDMYYMRYRLDEYNPGDPFFQWWYYTIKDMSEDIYFAFDISQSVCQNQAENKTDFTGTYMMFSMIDKKKLTCRQGGRKGIETLLPLSPEEDRDERYFQMKGTQFHQYERYRVDDMNVNNVTEPGEDGLLIQVPREDVKYSIDFIDNDTYHVSGEMANSNKWFASGTLDGRPIDPNIGVTVTWDLTIHRIYGWYGQHDIEELIKRMKVISWNTYAHTCQVEGWIEVNGKRYNFDHDSTYHDELTGEERPRYRAYCDMNWGAQFPKGEPAIKYPWGWYYVGLPGTDLNQEIGIIAGMGRADTNSATGISEGRFADICLPQGERLGVRRFIALKLGPEGPGTVLADSASDSGGTHVDDSYHDVFMFDVEQSEWGEFTDDLGTAQIPYRQTVRIETKYVTVHRAIDASDFFHCEKHVCVFWNKF